jgi:hypothetical protein
MRQNDEFREQHSKRKQRDAGDHTYPRKDPRGRLPSINAVERCKMLLEGLLNDLLIEAFNPLRAVMILAFFSQPIGPLELDHGSLLRIAP